MGSTSGLPRDEPPTVFPDFLGLLEEAILPQTSCKQFGQLELRVTQARQALVWT
jgi:hypothetical protein